MKSIDYKEEILGSLTDGFWLLSPDSPSMHVSHSFWKLLGVDYPLEKIGIGQMAKHVLHDERSLLESLLDWNECYNQTESHIICFLHAEGGLVWLEIKVKDLQNTSAKKRALMFFDISETKEIERVYNEFDSINNTGGWYVNIAKKQLNWTPYVYKIYGLEEGNLPELKDSITFYKEGESRNRITDLFNRSVEERFEFDDEFEFIDARGVLKWVRSRGKPVFENGKCTMVYGTIQDITQDKLKEQTLIESRRQFENVFNSTFQFCGILDADGTMLEINETAHLFSGVSSEEMQGFKIWDIRWWKSSKENQNRLRNAVKRAAKGELVRYNTIVLDKDQNEVAIDFNLKPLKGFSEKPDRLIAEGRVIQDLVDAQESLNKMMNKVTRQNETLRNFAHIVSHNLRSHAGNISLLTDVLNESNGDNLSEESISMLCEASGRLSETIDHVSDVVVIHTSDEDNYSEINLVDTAEKALASISAILSLASAKVLIEIPADLSVKGVPAYVDSIFLNLLSNAIKYKSKNRIPQVSIKASHVKKMVKIEFEDNGIGIDLKKHGDKLFGMYKTFHGNEDARGIGLFITKNQIESMGGQIEVKSKPGAGTKFDVYLNAL